VKLLLDTHTLVWFYLTSSNLSAAARTAIEDPANTVMVSAASYWEVAIKLALQRPILSVPFAVFVQEAIFDNGFTVLPAEPRHCERTISLPFHHRDPFDRLIAAQALVEGVPLVSVDVVFDQYGVQRVW
jgi:PIN domain nuclease of toxin-antitoxin system